MTKTMTLKDLNDFAKENGFSEDAEIYIFGKSRILSITEISTEMPSEDALYTNIYLSAEKEKGFRVASDDVCEWKKSEENPARYRCYCHNDGTDNTYDCQDYIDCEECPYYYYSDED